MQSIGENCYWVRPVIIEDDDEALNQVLETLDRWGDRRVPREASTISVLWQGVERR